MHHFVFCKYESPYNIYNMYLYIHECVHIAIIKQYTKIYDYFNVESYSMQIYININVMDCRQIKKKNHLLQN